MILKACTALGQQKRAGMTENGSKPSFLVKDEVVIPARAVGDQSPYR